MFQLHRQVQGMGRQGGGADRWADGPGLAAAAG